MRQLSVRSFSSSIWFEQKNETQFCFFFLSDDAWLVEWCMYWSYYFLKTNVFLLIALWFICIQMSRLAKWNRKFYKPKNPLNNFVGHRRCLYKIKSFTCEMKTIESDPIQWIYQKFLTKQMIELTNDDLNSWSKEDHCLLDSILSIILWK